MSLALSLALSLVVLGELPGPAAPEKVSITGKVREVAGGPAGEPRVLLELEDKTQLTLHGANAGDNEELRRLSGVRVKITGTKNDPAIPRGDHLRVDKYEILDAGRIGQIASLELSGKPRLIFVGEDGQAALLPESWVKKMDKHIGAKIWVAGNRSEGKSELVPQRYIILRTRVTSALEE